MLPPTQTSALAGLSTRRQSASVGQDDHSSSSARGEAGPSGSGKVARGSMYAMSKGTFAGESVVHSLELLQEPVSGRRRTDKDRRPLYHCPVLMLRVYKCHQSHTGDWLEDEVDVSTFESSSYVCAADLQPHASSLSVSGPIAPTVIPHPRRPQVTSILNEDIKSLPPPFPKPSRNPLGLSSKDTMSPPGRASLEESSTSHSPTSGFHRPHSYAPPYFDTPLQSTPLQRLHQDLSPTNDGAAALQDLPQLKRRKELAERNLFGALHLPALKLPSPSGELRLWYLFSDLTVQLEGTYTLRFRVYDLSTIEGYSQQPVQPLVEIQSSPFTVFSPRSFPGMPKATPLTEHFTSLGFKLTNKKNEKQARGASSPRGQARKSGSQRPAPQPIQTKDPIAPQSSSDSQKRPTSSLPTSSASGTRRDPATSSSSTSASNSSSTVRSMSSVSNMSILQHAPGGGSNARLGTLDKVQEAAAPVVGVDGDVEMIESDK